MGILRSSGIYGSRTLHLLNVILITYKVFFTVILQIPFDKTDFTVLLGNLLFMFFQTIHLSSFFKIRDIQYSTAHQMHLVTTSRIQTVPLTAWPRNLNWNFSHSDNFMTIQSQLDQLSSTLDFQHQEFFSAITDKISIIALWVYRTPFNMQLRVAQPGANTCSTCQINHFTTSFHIGISRYWTAKSH